MQSGYSSTVATLLNKTRGALQQHLRLNVKLKQNPCLRPIKAHWWIETWNSRLICNMLRWVMQMINDLSNGLKAPLSALYDVKKNRIPSNLRRSRTFLCWSCKWSSPSAPPLPSSSLHPYSSLFAISILRVIFEAFRHPVGDILQFFPANRMAHVVVQPPVHRYFHLNNGTTVDSSTPSWAGCDIQW